MTHPDRFRLSRADVDSPVWRGLSAHLAAEIDTLRRQNDASLPPERTENIRGRIAGIKAILALADDKPPQT
jgi:hypothetical protein